MKAKEADLVVLSEVIAEIEKAMQKTEAKGELKLTKAYGRLWRRLNNVYERTDRAINHVAGNA